MGRNKKKEEGAEFTIDKIELVSIETMKSIIDIPFDLDPENINHYDFQLSFDLGFNLAGEAIRTDIDVLVKGNDGQKEGHAIFSYAFIFRVSDYKQFVSKDERNVMILHPKLAHSIAGCSYSTARGMIFYSLKSSKFADFIIPVIDSQKIIDKRKRRLENNSVSELSSYS